MSTTPPPAGRRRRYLLWLLPWHIVLLVAFVVAYLSGTDASLAAVHLYAGCVVLGALTLRLVAGLAGGPLALPFLRRGRHPAVAAVAWLVILGVPAAAVTGWPAATSAAAAKLHSELGDVAAGLVTVHAAAALAVVAG